MDWKNLNADENWIINKHYTPGRGGNRIQYVVIHHNAGVLSIADCWNTWQTRQASAHYQVQTDGRIGQLVHDSDSAWHAGNFAANQRSIGIEHANSGGASAGWPISEATRENGAHLVAAICRYYGLGRPQWGVNVFPHQHFSSTACPGLLATTYRDSYMARAQAWYDAMVSGKAPAASAPKATTSTATGAAKTKTDGQLEITQDGILGGATIARWQQVMGTPIDGVISRGGSQLVIAFQKFLNSVVAGGDQKNLHGAATLATDGILGPATWKTYQFWSGNKLPGDMKNICGFTLTGSTIGKWVDGVAGKWTITMLQVMLNRSYAGSGKLLSK